MNGYIYCLTNEAIPGLVKIGKTTRDPVARAVEISKSTGVPTPFDIAWSRKVADVNKAEAQLHQALARCRHSKRREFFRCTAAQAEKCARGLSAFSMAKTKRRKRRNTDLVLGLSLTAITAGIFGSAVAFDLDAETIARITASTCLALTVIVQSASIVSMLRG